MNPLLLAILLQAGQPAPQADPPPPGSMPVGMCSPSANTIDLSALPSPSVSSRITILSLGISPGTTIG